MKLKITEHQMREVLWKPYNMCSMVSFLNNTECLKLWDSFEAKEPVNNLTLIKKTVENFDLSNMISNLIYSIEAFLDGIFYKEEESEVVKQAQQCVTLINDFLQKMHEEEKKEEEYANV